MKYQSIKRRKVFPCSEENTPKKRADRDTGFKEEHIYFSEIKFAIDRGSVLRGGNKVCQPWSPSSYSLPIGLTHACDASINLRSAFQPPSVERTCGGETWDVVDGSRCAWLAWEGSVH